MGNTGVGYVFGGASDSFLSRGGAAHGAVSSGSSGDDSRPRLVMKVARYATGIGQWPSRRDQGSAGSVPGPSTVLSLSPAPGLSRVPGVSTVVGESGRG